MGIFNDNMQNPHTANPGTTQGAVGPPGPGFKLTADGNYDIDNRKLTNMKAGTDAGDVMRKDQIETELANKISASQLSTAMAGKNKHFRRFQSWST